MAEAKAPTETNPSWERVQLARHPKRPHTLDYIQRLFTNFEELHGDRAYGDDHAIVAGPALVATTSAPRCWLTTRYIE